MQTCFDDMQEICKFAFLHANSCFDDNQEMCKFCMFILLLGMHLIPEWNKGHTTTNLKFGPVHPLNRIVASSRSKLLLARLVLSVWICHVACLLPVTFSQGINVKKECNFMKEVSSLFLFTWTRRLTTLM